MCDDFCIHLAKNNKRFTADCPVGISRCSGDQSNQHHGVLTAPPITGEGHILWPSTNLNTYVAIAKRNSIQIFFPPEKLDGSAYKQFSH